MHNPFNASIYAVLADAHFTWYNFFKILSILMQMINHQWECNEVELLIDYICENVNVIKLYDLYLEPVLIYVSLPRNMAPSN